jgi:RHS repeat-associated protein
MADGYIGEAGQISNLTQSPQTIVLNRTYQQSVVFVQPPLSSGPAPSVVRLTDVQSNRFTVFVQEATGEDGAHTGETMSYLVLEAGSWTLPDGARLDVGLFDTNAQVGQSHGLLTASGAAHNEKKYYNDFAMCENGKLYYLLTDRLGSISVVANASGNLVSRTLYHPWGTVRYSSASLPTDYTFTGQYSHVSDFGLLFFVARWYDPSLSRFAQADTIVPRKYDPIAYDRYHYASNNPVRYSDPSGHWSCDGTDNCEGWIQEVLGLLRNSGELGYGVWLFFTTYDWAMQEVLGNDGVHFYLDFGDGKYAYTPGLGKTAAGLVLSGGHLLLGPSIHVGKGYWSSVPDGETAALMGHEITHLFQGLIPSLSTQGEMVAYEVEFLLRKEMGVNLDGYGAEFHEYWDDTSDLSSLSAEDIARAQASLARGGSPVYSAEAFLGLGQPAGGALDGFYSLIYGKDALSVSLNPIPTFTALGSLMPGGPGGGGGGGGGALLR